MRLSTVWCMALLAAAAPGCKKKDKGEADNAAPKTTTAGVDNGSAAMAGSSAATQPPAAAVKTITGDDMAKRYTDCVALWKAKDWPKFQDCYAKDATSEFVDSGMPVASGNSAIIEEHKAIADAFPDRTSDVEVILINGHEGATIALLGGTNTGSMKTPAGDMAPTGKKFGLQVAHVVHFDADGNTASKELFYQDMGEMMGQLGVSKAPARAVETKPWHPLEVVVAKDDDAEKKNLANAQALMDSFNKRDWKALDALFDDKLVWSEQGIAKDFNGKAETVKSHQGLVKAFSDVKFSADTMWAAGDYVAWQGTMSGTNDGAAPEMGIAKATKKPIHVKFFQLLEYGKDGKLTKSYGFWNSGGLAMQLGLVPPPAAPPAKK
jgi:predicted ester cyclase